ncbi:MAG: nucleotide exchange factor GrpE [Clostridia bacterium]|nr:nucleotide exchange factor GrpE [Clostridia bacterium]
MAEEEKKVNTEETPSEEKEKKEAPKKKDAKAELEKKLSEAEEKLKESEDKYLRLYAEFDNYKKRTQKEKDARYADAVIDAVSELLPVLDNLERALAVEVSSEDAKALKDGVEMVKKQMTESLTKLKISDIKAVGEEFDPNLHNAVMHIDDDTITENTVVEEFMKGYIYNNERVVRYSMVKVAN